MFVSSSLHRMNHFFPNACPLLVLLLSGRIVKRMAAKRKTTDGGGQLIEYE